jgi:hypothetical protein
LFSGRLGSRYLFCGFIMLLLCFWHVVPGWSAGVSDCLAIKTEWEGMLQELKIRLQEFQALQQMHVEKIIQRPLVDKGENKSIARQVFEALQQKNELLNTKRGECRDLAASEERVFGQFQECVQSGQLKEKELKALAKKRQSFIDKVQISLAEVQEVEGKDTAIPYSEAMRDQDPYARSVNNYWQNYQQMYRRWWGQ